MYTWEFYRPYPEIALYAVICIICLCAGGYILKRYCHRWLCPHLIPLVLVITSFIVSNLYNGGFAALLSWGLYDIRAILNGLSAVGLYQLVTKTYEHIRYKRLKKDGTYKKNKKIAS